MGYQGAAIVEPTGVCAPRDMYICVWCSGHNAGSTSLSIYGRKGVYSTDIPVDFFHTSCSHLDCGPFTACKSVPMGVSDTSAGHQRLPHSKIPSNAHIIAVCHKNEVLFHSDDAGGGYDDGGDYGAAGQCARAVAATPLAPTAASGVRFSR
jgi:hypothetical protein